MKIIGIDFFKFSFKLICEAYHLMKSALGMPPGEMSKVEKWRELLYNNFLESSCI